MTKLDQLPSEILSLILNHVNNEDLPSCALINKSFYREAMPLLWRTLVIRSTTFIAITNRLMQSPHGDHVRSLTIANMGRCTSVLEHVQDEYFESLDRIEHIPRYCPHLTSLKIQNRSDPDPVASRIAQATVVSVGHYCKQLTTLILYNCVNSDYVDLFDALKDAPLTEIWLRLPPRLDPQVAQQFVETAPLALHRYQQLTTLSIGSRRDITSFFTTINTHGLTWPHLTSFTLWWCESLTDAMALLFVQTNPTIERLDLGCSKLTDAFLDGLVDALPNLTMLRVLCNPAITAPGICRLITNYGGLKDGVYCEGCGIYPEDLPNDKTYGYELTCDDEKAEVEWFDGTFS